MSLKVILTQQKNSLAEEHEKLLVAVAKAEKADPFDPEILNKMKLSLIVQERELNNLQNQIDHLT